MKSITRYLGGNSGAVFHSCLALDLFMCLLIQVLSFCLPVYLFSFMSCFRILFILMCHYHTFFLGEGEFDVPFLVIVNIFFFIGLIYIF